MMHVKAIGITGTIASGKDTVKDIMAKRLSCYQVNLSNAIRGEIEKKKKVFSRETMQEMGNELRQKYGTFVLVKVSTEFMSRDKPYLIVYGIRNPGEAEWLKKTYGPDFILVGIDAQQQTRFERVQKRARPIDAKTWEDFLKMDERDQGAGEPPYGQQVRKCIEMADVVIQNDGDEAQLAEKVEEVFSRIQ